MNVSNDPRKSIAVKMWHTYMREENKSNKKGKVWNDPEQWGEFPAELTGFLSQLPPRCQMAPNTGNQLNPTNHLYIKGWFTWKTWDVHFHILKSQFPCSSKWCHLLTAVSIKPNLDNAKFTHRKYSSNHTCKKRVMWRRRLFWPKKNCGKSA